MGRRGWELSKCALRWNVEPPSLCSNQTRGSFPNWSRTPLLCHWGRRRLRLESYQRQFRLISCEYDVTRSEYQLENREKELYLRSFMSYTTRRLSVPTDTAVKELTGEKAKPRQASRCARLKVWTSSPFWISSTATEPETCVETTSVWLKGTWYSWVTAWMGKELKQALEEQKWQNYNVPITTNAWRHQFYQLTDGRSMMSRVTAKSN